MLFAGLYRDLSAVSGVTALLGAVPSTVGGVAIYASVVPKQPPVPFLVIHRIDAPPAGQTLDGTSALIAGEIQFDGYANDQETAEKLVKALKARYFPAGGSNYNGTLPEGTTIQFTEVTADLDAGYEQGDSGYLYRSIMRAAAMYTEAS